MPASRVIAIAAPIGGGKSALAAALASTLGSATLRFDDYETATRQPVSQLSAWLAAGADFDQLEAPGLAAELTRLRTLAATPELVFEMPLGRAWQATAGAVDVLVWIDVPLDLALARRLREITATVQNPAQTLDWLTAYLVHYIGTIHDVLAEQLRVVRPRADLILDGRAEPAVLLRQVLDFLGKTP
jgi:hypothetical protein